MNPQPHQAGFVSIIGKPNVGKSTLLNALVGEKLSITHKKAQTTRHRICGILNGDTFQIVYADTPGVLVPAYTLQTTMMRAVTIALADADVLLWVVDGRDKNIPPGLQASIQPVPTLLLINKVDLLQHEQQQAILQYWTEQAHVAHILPISALHQYNITPILQHILTYLPVHPPYYPKDTLTDKPARFFAQEMIREKILQYYHQEIPYSVEVTIATFQETESLLSIHAILHVERNSQKEILIGKQGAALKKVGIAARQELTYFFKKKVYITQYVKVTPGWRANKKLLKQWGYEA